MTSEDDVDYIPPPPDSRRTSTFDTSTAETHWETQGNDEMDLEMLTEVMDGGEVDEEVCCLCTRRVRVLTFLC